MTHLLILFTGIGLATIASQWLAWRLRLPSILFLLLIGVIVGPVLGVFHPDQVFGELLFPLVSLAVAIILFEGSLNLKFQHIKGHGKTVRNLISIGFVITAALTAIAAHYCLHFNWKLAVMLGTITAVSGPTVIKPMLRSVRPTQEVAQILHWEGVLIDPIGALMAVLVFSAVSSIGQQFVLAKVVVHFVLLVVDGVFWGVLLGYFMGTAIRRHWMPDYLRNIFVLALVLIGFTVSEILFEGAGLLTVTVMGILVANMRGVHIDEILDFKESLSILLISILFIVLAARIEFINMGSLGWGLLVFLALLQFVVRPIAVWLSSAPSKRLNWREKFLLAWIAPRGIVCAAVAALFGLLLQANNIGDGRLLVLVSFIVIATTVVFQSATARLVAKLLHVSAPEPTGFLIIGANKVARIIAAALQDVGVKVMLADTQWENVRQTRLAGLPCYYGNPVSHHAERHLNLSGIGYMLGLSPQHLLNGLASVHYRREFGHGHVYSLSGESQMSIDKTQGKHSVAEQHNGRVLFERHSRFHKLAQWVNYGAVVKQTKLTAGFNFAAYQKQQDKRALPLFAVDPKGKVTPFTAHQTVTPTDGWTVIALVKPKAAA